MVRLELPADFPHHAPKGYSYEVKEFKRNHIAIWLRHHYQYVYNSDPVSTIWGFYNTKQRCYCSPVSASKCGDKVALDKTTPYTAMPLLKLALDEYRVGRLPLQY
jgi:hypothetical protein